VQQTLRNEGPRAFYKGVTPPLLTTGFINSLIFGLQFNVLKHTAADPQHTTVAEVAQAAIVTGALASVIITPMEGIKTRLQVSYGADGYKGPVDCIQSVCSKLGVRGLYRGWVPTCLCRMSNYAYFGPYEYMKRKIAAKQTGTPTLAYKMGTSVLAGATAGLCYWLSCYPMDVIKNRILAAPDVSPPTYVSPSFCRVTSLLASFALLLPFPAESGLHLPNMACFAEI
jgi:solute carrier family 25 carnitine/acylcarnitine transporter 20/29